MSENTDGSESGGPLWGKFFDGLGNAGDDDNTSMVSGSYAQDNMPTTPNIPKHLRQMSSATSPYSELHPGDSASAVDDESEVGGRKGGASSIAPAPPVDDGTYIFKFKTPSGRTHRFQARNDNYDNLKDIVGGKLMVDPFFTAEGSKEGDAVHLPDPNAFTMSYTDDDGDLVTITSDENVADAVRIARSQKSDRVVLIITGDKVWEEAAKDIGGAKALEVLKATKASLEEEKLFGVVPKDMVLPASIGFLGVVILGVFFATRGGKR